MGFLLIAGLIIESTILFLLEKKAWKTLLTPLNFLMLPYLAVLAVTILVSGHFDFIEFYYPSIMIWMVGLTLFAVPSLAFSYFLQRNDIQCNTTKVRDERIPRLFVIVAVLLAIMFCYRLMSTMSSSRFAIGSDDFAEEFAGHGLWGHLKRLCGVMLMLCIYWVDKKRKWLWLLIAAFFIVNVINMVKGTMIIPCVVGVMLRLASGKMKIDARFILILVFCSVAVFFVTYLLAMIIANDMEVSGKILLWIFQRFAHYLTSGTLGMSADMQLGFPDAGNFQVIWTPFLNIINQLDGSGEILSPVNPTYHFTGISLTNVRTFFGTLFIYTNYVQFVLYTVGLSAICYFLKYLTLVTDNLYTNTVYYYFCALLAMGWFEFYFFHLDMIENPAIIAVLHFIDWAFVGVKFKNVKVAKS